MNSTSENSALINIREIISLAEQRAREEEAAKAQDIADRKRRAEEESQRQREDAQRKIREAEALQRQAETRAMQDRERVERERMERELRLRLEMEQRSREQLLQTRLAHEEQMAKLRYENERKNRWPKIIVASLAVCGIMVGGAVVAINSLEKPATLNDNSSAIATVIEAGVRADQRVETAHVVQSVVTQPAVETQVQRTPTQQTDRRPVVRTPDRRPPHTTTTTQQRDPRGWMQQLNGSNTSSHVPL